MIEERSHMDKTITIVKEINAPRERVFDAYITPADIMQWYSAGDGWTIPYADIDAKAGGTFKIGFKDPEDKKSFDFEGTYNVVQRPERISYTMVDGRPVSVMFEDVNGQTKLTVVFAMEHENTEEKQREGWSAQLDHLADYLGQQQS
jgi:uncharacterized protein YndB with AHSA1/START domain